jgi:hypothetical protein
MVRDIPGSTCLYSDKYPVMLIVVLFEKLFQVHVLYMFQVSNGEDMEVVSMLNRQIFLDTLESTEVALEYRYSTKMLLID